MQILLLQTFSTCFRASCAHHQEYKILTRQPPVQVVMVAGGSSLRHIRDETDVKYARVSTSIPTVNMWCAHSTNPNSPIAIIAKIIPKFQNASFFPLS